MSADVDGQESDQSFGQRWLIFHSIVANNVFVAFDASMRRIDSLGGVNPLWTEQAPGWPAALRKWTLTFARGFFFWFPVAVALFVFALDRWSYFDIDPFLPTDKPPGTQAPLFYVSGVVFAACWIPLFVCCQISARYRTPPASSCRSMRRSCRPTCCDGNRPAVRSAWHSPRLFPGRDWLPRDARRYVFVDESGITNLLLLAYVEQVLVPALRPGDVVVIDNLAVHKQPAVPRGYCRESRKRDTAGR